MSLAEDALGASARGTETPPQALPAVPRPGTFRRLRLLSVLLMVALDVLAIVAAAGCAILVRRWALGPAADLSANVLDSAAPIALGFLLAIAVCGGYDPRLVPSGTELMRTLQYATLAAAGLSGTIVYLADIELSRAFFLAFFLLGPPLMLAHRMALRRMLGAARRHGRFRQGVLAVGSLDHIDGIARTLHRERWLGYDVVGAVTPAGTQDASALGIPVLGGEDDLLRITQEVRPGILLFTAGATATAEEFRRTAWKLEHEDVRVIVVPRLTEISADRLRMRPVAGLPLVHMDMPRARAALKGGKRLFDLVASAAMLAVLAPVLAAVALRVRLHDGGPVIFRQRRVGREGEGFEMLKFRTMVTDAEAVQVEMAERVMQDRGNAVMFKMRDDPRITRPGRFLRSYSLDELPQLWNVLRGDMSLVGPRPALPREATGYDGDAQRRLSVRPGITGLWQVSGRSDLSWEDTVRLDLYYVDNWSFTQDLQILVRTVRAVLASSGAY
ncbi:sugar transferase [Brachybacterium saurashtrense]|uniref:Sugar transferase n=1 Tax=Brachybacterium saurashtrense TaxID=556288 RepID=A0A345YSH0_9MICO|nr:sugar transferase [Brachybacterium saurashtrense]AXK46872.1 sugar transferase [Brachybacterium saurashtrense]RRR22587.1 sugar transferase [Brachybacterium saurashtrense]